MSHLPSTLAALGQAPLEPTLDLYLRGEISGPIALLHLISHFAGAEPLRTCLAAVAAHLRAAGGEPSVVSKVETLANLADWHTEGVDFTKRLQQQFDEKWQSHPGTALARMAAAYDAAYSMDRGAPVAQYTLRDSSLFERATQEVVTCLARSGWLTSTTRLLDFGAGSGRLIRPLAPRVARYIAVDISSRGLEWARREAQGLPNVELHTVSGASLRPLAEASVDLVIAVDSWPHLHEVGGTVEKELFDEVLRVLANPGRFVIMNYRYDDDVPSHEGRIRELSAGRLQLNGGGERPFQLWDGVVWELRR